MKHILCLSICFFALTAIAQTNDTIYLWPDKIPGISEAYRHPPVAFNEENKVTKLTEVTCPRLIVSKPRVGLDNGMGVIVCPGGGYKILAIDLSGTEIADWLNGLGYTTFILEYTIPGQRDEAFKDIQRAIRMVRKKSDEFGIDSEQIGIFGGSAGGHLCVRAATNYSEIAYDKVDKTDDISSRPNYAILLYPAFADRGEGRTISPELKITKETPPMFIFGTADDKHGNSSLVLASELRKHKVPVELHFLATGGHGYGLRRGNVAAETWPMLAEKWLKNIAKPDIR